MYITYICNQEQHQYTAQVRKYSVYGIAKVNLIYVDSCQTQDGGQNECDDVVMCSQEFSEWHKRQRSFGFGVAFGVGAGFLIGVAVSVSVAVLVSVAVADGVAVKVELSAAVCVGIDFGVGVRVGVDVGSGRNESRALKQHNGESKENVTYLVNYAFCNTTASEAKTYSIAVVTLQTFN
ncbi:unnamed protein product [Porites evermanni]|uniref:Uncharacterized protein n=1 Tax=Porites evermanni TaxID=104178 RepID=A0ABN8SI23_9CNID|nr:unnamed protein product [Porites evermanni]